MRNLRLEAALWYFFTAPEFYEMASKECEDTMEWFGNVAISHHAVNLGRNNQVYDAFKEAAREFRRGAEFARLGDYTVAREAAVAARTNIRGMMEQPFQSWMSQAEYEEFSSRRISNVSTYAYIIQRVLANAESGMRRFLIADPKDFDIRDRDEGFPGDSIAKEFEKYTEPQYENFPWTLPHPLPHYVIDIMLPCQTGDEVPSTGVWYPKTGFEHHSLTFAIKGSRMQPAYQVIKSAEALKAEGILFPSPETRAIATTWYPVIPVTQLVRDGKLRSKAGQPCPQTGIWQPLDPMFEKRAYQKGEIMVDLSSAYGLTIWQIIDE